MPPLSGCLLARTASLVLFRSLLVSLVCLCGCGEIATPTITAVDGNRGSVYFYCSGFVTSTRLWLAADPTTEYADAGFKTGSGRWDALARTDGDTLTLYSKWRFSASEALPLPYVLIYRDLDREVFGVHPNQVYQNPQKYGLTNVSC